MAIYLDDTQRNAIARLSVSRAWRTQWPTWALIVAIYGGWFGKNIREGAKAALRYSARRYLRAIGPRG